MSRPLCGCVPEPAASPSRSCFRALFRAERGCKYVGAEQMGLLSGLFEGHVGDNWAEMKAKPKKLAFDGRRCNRTAV
jgi:hypothetical protein